MPSTLAGSKLVPFWSWLQMGRDLIFIRLRYITGAWKLHSPQKTDQPIRQALVSWKQAAKGLSNLWTRWDQPPSPMPATTVAVCLTLCFSRRDCCWQHDFMILPSFKYIHHVMACIANRYSRTLLLPQCAELRMLSPIFLI